MKRGGFTLVEIMVAVALMCMIIAMALPNFIRSKHNANENLAMKSIRTLSTALEMYRINYGDYPENELPLISSNPPYVSNPDVVTGASGIEEGCENPYAGYCFGYAKTSSGYTYIAEPAVSGRTGTRQFIIDESGQVREYTFEGD